MKKILATFTLFLGITFALSALQAQTTSDLAHAEGYAKGALFSQCLNANQPAGYQLNSSVTVTGECPGDGQYVVRFWRLSPCPPNTNCTQVIYPVGVVTLDCDYNVLDVNCGPFIFPL